MSNLVSIQVTEDGARNSCFKVDVTLDSGDMTNYVIWDPLAMYIDYLSPTNSCAIDEIQYAVQNGISVGLYWDAPNPVPIVHLEAGVSSHLIGLAVFPTMPASLLHSLESVV